MSEENVEVVRRFIDAWQRDSDAMIEFLDPDIEWAPVEESHAPSHGHEGARRLREGWLDNWEEHQLDVEEVLDKGDQVVVAMRLRGRGKLSGVDVELVHYSQFTVRNGRITHIYEHAARGEALEAAGLSGWAMSEENVEIVRQHIAAYESGNYDAALAAYHPDVVCDATVRPEGRVYRGREGVAEAIRVWAGTWDDWHWDIEELIDAGDRVLMVVREFAKGKGSGVEVVQQTFWVYTLRGSQIVHAKVLVDKSQALEAAGLEE